MALTWNQIDTLVGNNGAQLIGSDLLMGGAIIAFLFLLFAFRVGLGLEASIIFGVMFAVWLGSSILGANQLIATGLITALAIVLGIVIVLSLKGDLK